MIDILVSLRRANQLFKATKQSFKGLHRSPSASLAMTRNLHIAFFNKFFAAACVVLTFLAISSALFAEDITVDATVDSTSVELGSALQLTITVNGASDGVPPLQLPKIDGLETRYLGPSTRISIINGKMSRSTGLMFSVIPLKTGQFTIPAITLVLNGKDYTTQPIPISVGNSSNANSTQAAAADKNSPAALQDKIFIILGTPKKEAYLNEPIPLVIKLFINDLAVKNVQYPTFEHDGFMVEDFGEPRRGQQTLGGIAYTVMEFRTFIYPTRTGELTLGPAKLGANILIKNSRKQDMPSQFGDFFNDDIFDNFLGRYETKTVMLESANIGIKVLPLPEDGKPADFSGGVGKYNFEMTVSPTTLKVGDPLTVRMRIAGDGNLKAVNFPAVKDSKNFKVYDPKITDKTGEKIFEQVVIPTHDKVTELPAVNFSYFDVVDKQYRTVTQGPFALTVSPLSKAEESKIVGTSAPALVSPIADSEQLGQDIRFIKENMGTLQNKQYVLYRDFGFVVGVTFLFFVWLGLFINFEYQKRLSTDIRLARRMHAPRQARLGLSEAGRFLHEKDARNFYDSIFKTLQDYFGNKFHLPSGTITVDTISEHLKSKDHKDKVIDSLREIFGECDLVRFASAQVPQEKMKSTFARTQQIIDFFERNY